MFEDLLKKHAAEIATLSSSMEMSDELYNDFYEYFLNSGEMPYGVAKARDGDPYNWIFHQLVA